MLEWNPTTHTPKYKKLPYFKGLVGKEVISGFSYVDSEYYDLLKNIMWVKSAKYIRFTYSIRNKQRLNISYKIDPKKYEMLHKYILRTSNLVDHKNGKTLDNRLKNLRISDYSLNALNSNKLNKTGYRGVSNYKDIFKAAFWNKNKQNHINLIYSKSRRKCAIAYDVAMVIKYKEHGKLNYPNLEKYHEKFSFYNDVKEILKDTKI